MQKITHALRGLLKPEHWFVCTALLFGLIFALFVPPYLGGDEVFHFTRAYQVAEGQLMPIKNQHGTGGYVPKSIFAAHGYIDQHHSSLADIKAATEHFPLNKHDRMFVAFESTAVNNPLMYAPQVLGIWAGLMFEAPPATLMYLARLANLVFYVALMYAAIRLLPFGKHVLMVLCLLPMNIVASASGSADTFTITTTTLFIATILHLCARKTKLPAWGIAGFLLLAAAVSLTKLPAAVFLLLTLLVPARVFGGSKKAWAAIVGAMAALALIIGGGWIMVIAATLSPYGPPGVDVASQLHFMLQNPLHFLNAGIVTYFSSVSDGMVTAAALALTPTGAVLPLWATAACLLFVSHLFPVAAAPFAWTTHQKGFLVAVMGMFILGITALLYLSWTPVGGYIVEGIHPRYFIPLLFMLIPLLSVKKAPVKTVSAWVFIWPIVFLILGVGVMAAGFYA